MDGIQPPAGKRGLPGGGGGEREIGASGLGVCFFFSNGTAGTGIYKSSISCVILANPDAHSSDENLSVLSLPGRVSVGRPAPGHAPACHVIAPPCHLRFVRATHAWFPSHTSKQGAQYRAKLVCV